ncbi:MAG: hypothetical protein KatS3mg108_0357 [Isosphaeraceae bacterium]|nr:MAG: hypothetical protein KatS3mg108_0357 [Isosphaeraceae bacterium]
MRTGWRLRRAITTLAGLLALAGLGSVRGDEAAPVQIALELDWQAPELPPLPDRAAPPPGTVVVDASVVGGRILDAVAVPEPGRGWPAPDATDPPRPHPQLPDAWRLGSQPQGRVRLLVEAPLTAALLVDAGGSRTRFALASVLEGPQTTLPQATVRVRLRQLAWDALRVQLGHGEGLYAPAEQVPLSIGFHLLTPEPTQVAVRYSAQLRPIRGGPAVWRLDPAPEVLPTNQPVPPGRMMTLVLPDQEGTYLLEVQATWEPADAAAGEGLRLLRWLRRNKKPGTPVSVIRRSTLVVLSPSPPTPPKPESAAHDVADFRGGRPYAQGRSPKQGQTWPIPQAALTAPGLRDRIRDWISRSDTVELPPADGNSLAWTAVPLTPPRPGQPHRLTVDVAAGPRSDLAIALVALGRDGNPPRILLDARGRPSTSSWWVWPDATEVVAIVANQGQTGPIRLRSIRLDALPSEPSPAPLVETHGEAGRLLALDASAPGALDRFGGQTDAAPSADVLTMAQNLAGYLRHVGAAAVVLPAELADRAGRLRLQGQAAEDVTAPDSLALMLRVLGRSGLSALVRVDPAGTLPGLAPPSSPEAVAQNLVRIDAQGQPEGVYNALHPAVATALQARLAATAAVRLTHPNLVGVVLAVGAGPTVAGPVDSGLDDATYQAFAKASFAVAGGPQVPGLSGQPDRFAQRAAFVTGPARRAWDDWRAARLGASYLAWAHAVAEAAPGATLAIATPRLDDGPAGREARRAERAGLPPDEAWRAVGFDPARWPAGSEPLLLRSLATSDELSQDLAASPELDAIVAARPARGATLLDPIPPDGALNLESETDQLENTLVHAVAAIDPRWVLVGTRQAAGHEAELARFARLFRALPAPADPTPPRPRLTSGVALRWWSRDRRTYLVIANDTPYEILQAARLDTAPATTIDDLGRDVRLEPAEAENGGRTLVLRLPPYGLTTLRIADADATIEPQETYLPDLARLDAEAEELAARLGRTDWTEGLVGPPLPGFEPPQAATTPPAPAAAGGGPQSTPGWNATSDAARVSLDPVRPHSGQTALRLDAAQASAAVSSAPFLPPDGPALTARLWLRADQPGRRVRIWFEGEADGQAVVRRADLTAGPDWAESRLRLLELPPHGLDTLRVRLEWLAAEPGTLWIDDLSLSGEETIEPGRRMHRALIEALQAYRARRYADFARLMRSRRTRRAVAAAERIAAEPDGAGRPTDLSPSRRLR